MGGGAREEPTVGRACGVPAVWGPQIPCQLTPLRDVLFAVGVGSRHVNLGLHDVPEHLLQALKHKHKSKLSEETLLLYKTKCHMKGSPAGSPKRTPCGWR